MAARSGFKLATLWTNGAESTNEPPRSTYYGESSCSVGHYGMLQIHVGMLKPGSQAAADEMGRISLEDCLLKCCEMRGPYVGPVCT